MRILILGASGMLGHKLWQSLSIRFPEAYATIRGCRNDYKKFALFKNADQVIEKIDALNFPDLEKVFGKIKPEVILNCVGLTKRRENANNLAISIALNALLPHQLAAWGEKKNVKIVNFSTDCVFDGETGNYTEESSPSATDVYGKTKGLGEVKMGNTLTLRSSFIGPELSHGSELLEWFLAQSGSKVKGFRNAIYSGLTTFELCRVVEKLLVDYPNARGLYNVSSAPISKLELLMLIREKMELDIEIIPEDEFNCNRSLDSSKFRKEFDYSPPSWKRMIDELANKLKGEGYENYDHSGDTPRNYQA